MNSETVSLPTPQERAARILAARLPLVPKKAPTLKLGQIAQRLGFQLTAEFLRKLGFEAVKERGSCLYHESDFSMICDALVQHISAVQARKAA